MEGFKGARIDLLTCGEKLDRHTGDGTHREGSTAAGITIHLRHNETCHLDALVEAFGDTHCLLPGHGIDNKQALSRLNPFVDLLQLLHEWLVDLESPSSVDDQDISHLALGLCQSVGRDIRGARSAPFTVDGYVDLTPQGLELGDSRGTVNVTRCQQHLATLLAQVER